MIGQLRALHEQLVNYRGRDEQAETLRAAGFGPGTSSAADEIIRLRKLVGQIVMDLLQGRYDDVLQLCHELPLTWELDGEPMLAKPIAQRAALSGAEGEPHLRRSRRRARPRHQPRSGAPDMTLAGYEHVLRAARAHKASVNGRYGMHATKFTPGPWRVNTTGNIGNVVEAKVDRLLDGLDDGWRAVALYQAVISSPKEGERDINALANAHLIAAAPDLYTALAVIRHLWAGHSEMCASVVGGRCDCDWPKIEAQCDAALASARGEQP